jgi:hypothetical protein
MHSHKERLEYAYLYKDDIWTCYDIFASITITAPFNKSVTAAVEDIMRDLDLFRSLNGHLAWERSSRLIAE